MRIRLYFALALSLVALPASAQSFSNIIFFGDSLTDSGRYLYLPRNIGNPATFATAGGYTTNPGPMWSVGLGQKFGIVVTPSSAPGGGNNYAAGGARVVFDIPGTNVWSTNSQIIAYLASTGGIADPNALYVYWVGFNDLRTFTAGGPGNIVSPPNNAAIITLAQQAIGQVAKLAAAGAQYILVPNTILSTLTPAAAAAGGFVLIQDATDSKALYDQTLWNGLAANGIRFIPADFNTVWNHILTNPAPFGITVTSINTPACGPTIASINCGPANYVTPNADKTYFFADGPLSGTGGGGHLTTALQQIETDYFYSLIVAPSMISMLAEAPLKTRESLISAINNQITISQSQQRGPSGFNAWLSGNVSWLRINNYPGFPDDPGIPLSLIGGVDYKAPSGWLLGTAFSFGTQKAHFGLGFGSFTQNEFSASVYAAKVVGPAWFNFIGTYGTLHYDVNRTVPIGITIQNNVGTTSGNGISFAANTGYNFATGSFTHGPVVGINLQQVHVSGFTESGSFTSLGFGTQTRNSAVSVLGYQASYILGAFQPFAQITWDHELASDNRLVSASLTTIIAPSYSMPAVVVGKDWAAATVGTKVIFGPGKTALFAFSSDIAQHNVRTYRVQFAVNMAY